MISDNAIINDGNERNINGENEKKKCKSSLLSSFPLKQIIDMNEISLDQSKSFSLSCSHRDINDDNDIETDNEGIDNDKNDTDTNSSHFQSCPSSPCSSSSFSFEECDLESESSQTRKELENGNGENLQDISISQDQIEKARSIIEEIHLLGPFSFIEKCKKEEIEFQDESKSALEIMSKLGLFFPKNANIPLDPIFKINENDHDEERRDFYWSLLQKFISKFIYRRKKLPLINTLNDVINLLYSSNKIIILTGAGISVSCGIPDFRSKNGLYSQIQQKYNLPSPECMFDIEYFKMDPLPFFLFAKEIFPDNYKPSISHEFIAHLEKKGKLLRNFTQNIDTLESRANIQNVVYCHGSFSSATCMTCKRIYSIDELRRKLNEENIPKCDYCHEKENGKREKILNKVKEDESENENDPVSNGIIKPDIVFFGESLPSAFHHHIERDVCEADLILVIGSSLSVYPVASIPNLLPPHVPQILINKEPLNNFNFDVELIGECDVILEILKGKLEADACELNDDSRGNNDHDYQFISPNKYIFKGAHISSTDDDNSDEKKEIEIEYENQRNIDSDQESIIVIS